MKALITLDYDPSAFKVAETGFSLAKTMGAEITLLHVTSDPIYYTMVDHITIMGFSSQMRNSDEIPQEKMELKKLSQQFLDKTKLQLGDAGVQTLLKEGDCAQSILDIANDMKADVIIMGSHSNRGLKNKTMGSVTEKVLINTTIPVLIIPTKKHSL